MRMMNVRFGVTVCLAISSAAFGVTQVRTFNHGGVQRTYRLHVPPLYDGHAAVPLILAIHGMTDNSQNFENTTRLSPLADAQGLLVAYPQALVQAAVTQWNVGFREDWADDVGFLLNLIWALEGEFTVDPNRVFIMGHSNGAFMCHTLAAVAPYQIAGVCSVAGNLCASFIQPGPQVSVLHIQGLADTIVPVQGISGQYPGMYTFLGWWREYNGCELESKTLFSDSVVTGSIWINRAGCGDVVLYTLAGLGHVWPTNYNGFSATETALDFFRTHPRSLSPLFRDPRGPVLNTVSAIRYNGIARAVLETEPDDTITVEPGVYAESLWIGTQTLTVLSTDPADANIVAGTVIQGIQGRPVVSVSGSGSGSTLAGLTLTGSGTGVLCDHAQAAIRHCVITGCGGPGVEVRGTLPVRIERTRIVEALGAGLSLSERARPDLVDCLIAANRGAGITMSAMTGRRITYCEPNLVNCTIVQNGQPAILGGEPVISNSILYFNGPQASSFMEPHSATVRYSCVQGGALGPGNIDADPCFVSLGYWAHVNDPSRRLELGDPNAIWVPGDYHLVPGSPCIGAGDPNSERIDMGALTRIVEDSILQLREQGGGVHLLACER